MATSNVRSGPSCCRMVARRRSPGPPCSTRRSERLSMSCSLPMGLRPMAASSTPPCASPMPSFAPGPSGPWPPTRARSIGLPRSNGCCAMIPFRRSKKAGPGGSVRAHPGSDWRSLSRRAPRPGGQRSRPRPIRRTRAPAASRSEGHLIQGLASARPRQVTAAIAGVGETGTPEDAELVMPFLGSLLPRNRRTSLRASARWTPSAPFLRHHGVGRLTISSFRGHRDPFSQRGPRRLRRREPAPAFAAGPAHSPRSAAGVHFFRARSGRRQPACWKASQTRMKRYVVGLASWIGGSRPSTATRFSRQRRNCNGFARCWTWSLLACRRRQPGGCGSASNSCSKVCSRVNNPSRLSLNCLRTALRMADHPQEPLVLADRSDQRRLLLRDVLPGEAVP